MASITAPTSYRLRAVVRGWRPIHHHRYHG